MNALVPIDPPKLSYDEIWQLATSIAKSGLFGMKTPDQAVTLMMLAQAEGMHPATAARDYDIIQNRAAKKSEAMHRDFLRAGGKITWHKLDDTGADATFSHPMGGEARISWDMARAEKAGLGKKENYSKFTRQMFRSRVVSEGVRTVWPIATGGLYVPEEVREMQPEHNGTTLDAEPEPPVPLRAAAAATPRPPRVTAPAERTDDQWRVWLDKLRAACAVLYSRQDVVEIGERSSVGDAIATGPGWVQKETSSILAEAYKRFADDDGDAASEDLEEVQIAGAEKLAAGD